MFDYDRGYFHTTEQQALRSFCQEYDLHPPYVNEVCATCRGEGKRALGGMVLNEESMQDRDFMEDYMDGKYDSRCEDCNGERVVKVPQFTPEQQKLWDKWMRDVRRDNAESLMELRMGC